MMHPKARERYSVRFGIKSGHWEVLSMRQLGESLYCAKICVGGPICFSSLCFFSLCFSEAIS